jgi:hypothetical protein
MGSHGEILSTATTLNFFGGKPFSMKRLGDTSKKHKTRNSESWEVFNTEEFVLQEEKRFFTNFSY